MSEEITGNSTIPETTAPAEETQGFLAKLGEALGLNKTPAAKQQETTEEVPAKEGDTDKTYTQADFDAMLEQERQKWAAEQEAQAKLAKLPPEDRAKAEADARAQELAAVKAQLLQRDLKDTAVAKLAKDGYPVGLADILDYSSKEAMEASLSKVADTFTSSLGAAINEKLRGKSPEGLGGASTAENAIKDQIAGAVRGAM